MNSPGPPVVTADQLLNQALDLDQDQEVDQELEDLKPSHQLLEL